MIKFSEFYGQDIERAKKLALDYRLHMRHSKSNGVVKGWYRKDYGYFKCFVIAFDNEAPIGCSCINIYDHISVYVCQKYRRQGIGTKLVKMATKNKIDVFH